MRSEEQASILVTLFLDNLTIAIDWDIDHQNQQKDGLQICSSLEAEANPWRKKWVIFWNDGPKHIKLNTSILTADYTVKPVLSGHSKKKPNYRLMQVKNIEACSKGSILQPFWPSWSYHLLLKSLFCLFFWVAA